MRRGAALAAAVILLCCLTFCGCDERSDYLEPENKLIISALGVDSGKKEITLTAEAVTVSENGNSDGHEREVLCGKGGNMRKAFSSLKNGISKRITLSHCAVILLGDTVCPDDFEDVLVFCFSEQDLTGNVQLAAAKSAEEILKTDVGDNLLGYSISAMFLKNRDLPSSGAGCTIVDAVNFAAESPYLVPLPLLGTNNNKEGEVFFRGIRYYKNRRSLYTASLAQSQLIRLANGDFHHGELTVDNEALGVLNVRKSGGKIYIYVRERLSQKSIKEYENRISAELSEVQKELPSAIDCDSNIKVYIRSGAQ